MALKIFLVSKILKEGAYLNVFLQMSVVPIMMEVFLQVVLLWGASRPPVNMITVPPATGPYCGNIPVM